MNTKPEFKYETMYEYVEHADIHHYSISAGALPVSWPGIVWVQEFQPRNDPDFTLMDVVNGGNDEAPLGYDWVNWGEQYWVLLRHEARNDEVYARYEYQDGEFISDGRVYETEEKAWGGWKSVDEMYTPNINDEVVTKEIAEFIESRKDIGVDEKGYIWMKDFGYFEDIDSLVGVKDEQHDR